MRRTLIEEVRRSFRSEGRRSALQFGAALTNPYKGFLRPALTWYALQFGAALTNPYRDFLRPALT